MSESTSNSDDLAAQLARKTTELQILQRVSTAINATLDLDEIYEVALRTMDELFDFHHANILLLEEGGETLQVVASRGYETQSMGGRVALGTGVIGIVAQKRKMLHVNNLGQQRAYAAAQRRQMVKAGRGDELSNAVPVPGLPNAESQIAIPLLMEDRLLGVFSIESPVRRSFGAHEEVLVAIVANQIASAIHNARLYGELRRTAQALQRANESLEGRVQERTAELERELRVAQELVSDARRRVEGPLLGESAAVRALRSAIVEQGAEVETLLVTGPPGTGKEATARAVHGESGRRGAFIHVNCAQLQSRDRSALVSSAPTEDGNAPSNLGKLDLAARGTLYLEAVHELALELQGRLRDFLQDREESLDRGRAPVPDVRVIVSTTRDLAREADAGRFDPRLLRLLGRNRLAVPALADRRDDVPVLVDHFLRAQARQLGKMVSAVSEDSLQRLQAYRWPGNVRELQSVIERAVLVARHPVIEIDEDALGEGLAAGSYRLIERIGAGGMGEVWLGRHQMLARPAAVKLIRTEARPGAEQDKLVRRFQREAQVTAGLSSPHTVQLYDFGINDSGGFYYVMELLHGLDVARIVQQFGPQPAERVILFLRQACLSLAEAHDQGLVHRDIKPANLFVTRLGPEYDYVKVLDFGMVKGEPGEDATQISAQGIVHGTPAFMAPELVTDETAIDGRADLYSLGCTAYQALTGRNVFAATSPTQMLLEHVRSSPRPPSEGSPLPIPAALDALVLRCLEKDPAKRPASALELDALLSRVPCEPWTQERARAWWQRHVPDAGGNNTAPARPPSPLGSPPSPRPKA